MTPRNEVLAGDAASVLATLAPGSVSTVVTSPPYFRLRNYDAGARELGQEHHVDEWVGHLRTVSREVARVLAPWGSYWLVVGDSYSRHVRYGAPPKSLLLGPERLARSLLADGWIIRGRICWAKTTPLPSPIVDRLSNTWEYVWHMVRQRSYHFDLDAIRVPLATPRQPGGRAVTPERVLGRLAGPRAGLQRLALDGRSGHPLGKNPGDFWHLPPGRAIGGHRATFPESLVRRPILATAPRHVCTACGRPWRRSSRRVAYLEGVPQPRPLVPCGCGAPTRPGLVLDPFAGSGVTLKVARELGRDALGIELNPEFVALARERAGFSEPSLGAAQSSDVTGIEPRSRAAT